MLLLNKVQIQINTNRHFYSANSTVIIGACAQQSYIRVYSEFEYVDQNILKSHVFP